jgi:hypothetical protein
MTNKYVALNLAKSIMPNKTKKCNMVFPNKKNSFVSPPLCFITCSAKKKKKKNWRGGRVFLNKDG